MTSAPPPADRSAVGWIRFPGSDAWVPSRFVASPPSGAATLVVGSNDAEHPWEATLPLSDVTALDEIIGAPEGQHHVEMAVRGRVAFEAAWPEAFTGVLIVALAATVQPPAVIPPPPPLSQSIAFETAPHGEPAPPAGPTDRPAEVATRSRARHLAGTIGIGATALAGAVAIIIGALNLSEAEGAEPRGSLRPEESINCPPRTTTPVDAAPLEECAGG
ncbi:MAG TPA: hypothetical protein PLV93_05065 [Microthrixaceae bacterium]|nr:hypothetical protein [Microthrixaceae bacterium]HNI34745.1 hypothetical protein [Microthrixaceae bacterium]